MRDQEYDADIVPWELFKAALSLQDPPMRARKHPLLFSDTSSLWDCATVWKKSTFYRIVWSWLHPFSWFIAGKFVLNNITLEQSLNEYVYSFPPFIQRIKPSMRGIVVFGQYTGWVTLCHNKMIHFSRSHHVNMAAPPDCALNFAPVCLAAVFQRVSCNVLQPAAIQTLQPVSITADCNKWMKYNTQLNFFLRLFAFFNCADAKLQLETLGQKKTQDKDILIS